MAKIIRLVAQHPLVGTWMSASDYEFGGGVRFIIAAAGTQFDVQGQDTNDGELLEVSNVRWDGQTLRFDSLVPSNGHRVAYEFECIAPDEVRVRYTISEAWVRSAPGGRDDHD